MSHDASSSAELPSNAVTRQRMEQCIDRLAELARGEVDASRFVAEVLRGLLEFSQASLVRFWRPSQSGNWEVAGALPVPDSSVDSTDAERLSQRQSLLNDVASTRQLLSQTIVDHQESENRSAVVTICPIVHTDQVVALLETVHPTDPETSLSLPPNLIPFFQAIAEIAADYLAQLELRQLRRARLEWQRWDQLSQSLMRAPDTVQLGAATVNDGRLVVECDRISLLKQSGSQCSTIAISGVERPETRSNTVRSLENLALLALQAGVAVWHQVAPAESSPSPEESDWLAEYARQTGSKVVGLIPMTPPAERHQNRVPTHRAVLVVEQFDNVLDVAGLRSRAELLARRVEPLLMASLDRDSIPLLSTLNSLRRLPGWILRPGMVMGLIGMSAIVGMLCVIPGEFTVTSSAELVPDHRRDVFASRSGIVEQVLVNHGDEVTLDQPLLVLHDPQLALDLPKVIGEMEIVRERLKGVLAARLAGGISAEAANRARQLTSEEEELKERLQSLERQKQLIEQQQRALTLRSPLQGKVLTWDVPMLLSARPVERGQSLLTIGDTAGPWVVEVRVSDRDFGHIRRAQIEGKTDLHVDFLLPSDPERVYRGRIRDVAETTQWDEQHGNSVLIVVSIEPDQQLQPRSGMTALTRIHCGKQPIGYVWLHDLIDAIRTRILF